MKKNQMIVGLRFEMNPNLFNKDPQDTALGKRILNDSIFLMNEIGLESFTFKKLAQRIDSTERSIYRYFENKHLLLLYLSSWYWHWVNYLIQAHTRNMDDPKQRLETTIKYIVRATAESHLTEYINENALHQLIIKEGSKAYHTLSVDEENRAGLFLPYKELVEGVAANILEIKPDFPYAESLASNLFEMASNQIFFADHLPRMTSLEARADKEDALIRMMKFFAFKILD